MTINERDAGIVGLWQEQPREEGKMELTDIAARATAFEERTHRQNLGAAVALTVVVIGNLLEFVLAENDVERVGAALVIAAVFFVVYQVRKHRTIEPKPADFGFKSCTDFYRAHIERQRRLVLNFWFYALPFAPGIFLSVVGGLWQESMTASRYGALAAGLAGWVGVIMWMNRREARRLQQELDKWVE
jgi:hypothetical protein